MGNIKDAGYIMVINPRSEVLPLDLLSKSGKSIQLLNSPAYELFIAQSKAPPLIKDKGMAENMNTEEVLDLNIESHAALLDKLVSIIHTKASADLSFNKQKQVTVQINKPTCSYVSEIALDSFLQDAHINEDAAGTMEKLYDGELYIITEIIKSRSFSIEDDHAEQIALNANIAVHDIADTSASVSSNRGRKELIKHDNDTALTFAVKAKQILYDKPGFFSRKKGIFKLRDADNIVLVKSADESFPSKSLTTSDGFINI